MKLFKAVNIISFLLATCLLNQNLKAQDTQEDDEIKGVESELEKNIPSRSERTAPTTSVVGKKQDTLLIDGAKEPKSKSNIVVIQKNYMPKSGRFSLSGGLTLFPSDVFFKTFGAQIRRIRLLKIFLLNTLTMKSN